MSIQTDVAAVPRPIEVGPEMEALRGGGETGTAVAQAGVKDRLTHASTGGGALLEFMKGKGAAGRQGAAGI